MTVAWRRVVVTFAVCVAIAVANQFHGGHLQCNRTIFFFLNVKRQAQLSNTLSQEKFHKPYCGNVTDDEFCHSSQFHGSEGGWGGGDYEVSIEHRPLKILSTFLCEYRAITCLQSTNSKRIDVNSWVSSFACKKTTKL